MNHVGTGNQKQYGAHIGQNFYDLNNNRKEFSLQISTRETHLKSYQNFFLIVLFYNINVDSQKLIYNDVAMGNATRKGTEGNSKG